MSAFSDRIKRYGWCGCMLNVFEKIVKKCGFLVENFCLFACQIDQEDLVVYAEYDFRELIWNDFIRQSVLNPDWFSLDKLRSIRVAFSIKGNRSYGCFDGDLLISYGWISTDCFGLSDRILLEDDGYLWDAYTHPKYRGKGLHKQMNIYRMIQLKRFGKKRVLSVVAAFNKSSKTGFYKTGFTLIERYMVYGFGTGAKKETMKYGKKE